MSKDFRLDGKEAVEICKGKSKYLHSSHRCLNKQMIKCIGKEIPPTWSKENATFWKPENK